MYLSALIRVKQTTAKLLGNSSNSLVIGWSYCFAGGEACIWKQIWKKIWKKNTNLIV